MFLALLIAVVALLHAYVFWRVASLPFVPEGWRGGPLVWAGVASWLLFLLSVVFGHGGRGPVVLELFGMGWLGALFLLSVPLLAVDVLTVFGRLFRRLVPRLRSAAFLFGGMLTAFSLVQGLRPPVVTDYEVTLAGLPRDADGTVIVALSDLHLGDLRGTDWLASRVEQVRALKPDAVVLLGDIFEGHDAPRADLVAALGRLPAPLGVWGVLGNHEFYGALQDDPAVADSHAFRLLRNRWTELRPGLVLAGVDDLTVNHRPGEGSVPLKRSLAGRPPGATVLLSHSPREVEAAARDGVGLMLCGHTHGGQIWPFGYLVRLFYPVLEGRHQVDGMTVIVSRGTGGWGPPMRLWQRGEILRVTLRAEAARHGGGV